MNHVVGSRLLAALALVLAASALSLVPAGIAESASDENATIEQADPLDMLFEELKYTKDKQRAEALTATIWRHWLKSGSDTVDLLMKRANALIEVRELDDALQILDTVVEMAPNFAEGWNRRATVYFLLNMYGPSISDVRRVLALEPRHFGALTGLGAMLKQTDRKAAALEIFRRALEIHPFLDDAQKTIDALAIEVDGRGI